MSAIAMRPNLSNWTLEALKALQTEIANQIEEKQMESDFGPHFVDAVGRKALLSVPVGTLPQREPCDHPSTPQVEAMNAKMENHGAIRGFLSEECKRAFVAVKVECLNEKQAILATLILLVYRRYACAGELHWTVENSRWDTRTSDWIFPNGSRIATDLFPDCRLRENHLRVLGQMLSGETVPLPTNDPPKEIAYLRMKK